MRKIYFLLFLLLAISALQSQDISQQLNEYITKPKGHSSFNGTVLVVQNGHTLLYKAMGWKNGIDKTLNDTSTIYRIGSLSKPFTATIILRLEQEKRLSLNDRLSQYIADYPNGDSITIEHLLTHSSGIREYLTTKEIQQAPDSAPPIPIEKLIGYFKNEATEFRAGEKFSYSNSNYILLAYIIEKVTGLVFEHAARKYIFEPLHMEHSGFDFRNLGDTNKATGHTALYKKVKTVEDFDSTYAPGCGSMYSTAMDLYKWYKGLLSGKIINDAARERTFIARQWKYGYGWFSYMLYGKRCISHAGGVPGFYTNFQFFPDDDVCIILLTNSSTGHIDTDKIAAIVFQQRYKSSGL